MIEASPSAAQVFDAALRAEAEGNLDYAIQFYRHLSEHHGEAPEAIAARAALSRMAQPRPVASGARRPPAPPVATSGVEGPRPDRPRPRKPAIRIAPVGDSEHRSPPMALPEPIRAYATARAIAYVLSTAGATAAALAALVTVLQSFAPDILINATGAAGALLLNPVSGSIGMVCGLAAFFIGQVALALFDCANASRELVAIERAKVEQAHRHHR